MHLAATLVGQVTRPGLLITLYHTPSSQGPWGPDHPANVCYRPRPCENFDGAQAG